MPSAGSITVTEVGRRVVRGKEPKRVLCILPYLRCYQVNQSVKYLVAYRPCTFGCCEPAKAPKAKFTIVFKEHYYGGRKCSGDKHVSTFCHPKARLSWVNSEGKSMVTLVNELDSPITTAAKFCEVELEFLEGEETCEGPFRLQFEVAYEDDGCFEQNITFFLRNKDGEQLAPYTIMKNHICSDDKKEAAPEVAIEKLEEEDDDDDDDNGDYDDDTDNNESPDEEEPLDWDATDGSGNGSGSRSSISISDDSN